MAYSSSTSISTLPAQVSMWMYILRVPRFELGSATSTTGTGRANSRLSQFQTELV